MPCYSANAISAAPPAAVWRLLLDARTWPAWSPVDGLDLQQSSGLDPDGRDPVGAVRAFRTGKIVTGERLTGLVEEKQMTYEDAFNKAIHDYRAVIDLTPTDNGGTAIHWHGTYSTGPLRRLVMRRVMSRVMQRMADGLAAYAEQPAPA